ncbi:MAG: hypothetical protein QOF45_1518 [Gaiellaceae bacterium]|nr:hypothetical protein [Gaiellaceae bacterium]
MPDYEICFAHTGTFDDALVVGDAVRWVGTEVWRVEAVAGNRATVRLWPDDEPYPARITKYGPGEWPEQGES